MTTQGYFLEFIIAYHVMYWMECRSLKYDVDMYDQHTCSMFIRSKAALSVE